MFSHFERMIAGRYLRARGQESFISVVVWFSLIGIAIGEDQDHQPQAIQQLKQVVKKLQENQLKGILWRSENILEQDEIVGVLEERALLGQGKQDELKQNLNSGYNKVVSMVNDFKAKLGI